jgi:DNA (cytosine-5)-methyltransferase 1
VREKLEKWGGPWIMENVVGAPLRNPATVCGLALGLKVKRHRLFESNILLLTPPCPSHDQEYYVIFGHEVRCRRPVATAGRKNKIAEGRKAMGIDWMTRGELSEAIPPAYAELLCRQVIPLLRCASVS